MDILKLDNENEMPIGMKIAMRFTIPEQNIVCIYKQKTKFETMEAIRWAKSYVLDMDIRAVMDVTIDKLDMLTEDEFELAEFVETAPDEE